MPNSPGLSGVIVGAALSLVAALPLPAYASFIATATLSGANQVPPVVTPASGTAAVTYDSTLGTLTYQVSFADLTSPSLFAHIHVAPPGTNGPVVLPFDIFPIGTTTGSSSGVADDADLTGNAGITTIADLAIQIQAGNAYVNIHSENFPAGEIRGQLAVQAVPEPASLALLGAGVLATVMARRRTQRGTA